MLPRSELREGLTSLLALRDLVHPDGRPLYAYRFKIFEIERVAQSLRHCGPSALHDRNGAALAVAYIAEWFRRERSGGHWDWIRPLATLGFEYGPYSEVQYRDIEIMVSLGLSAWRRPGPSGGERLLAIVREAGFPVASVREDPRISSWLRYSVLCAERGFSTRDAVGAEAWRVSDKLAQALFDPAIDLCDKIIELRRSLPPPDARGDPVDHLDQNRPGWRDELPFDVECEDIRSMVEQVVRTRDDGAAALDVSRHLVRTDAGWEARAALGLSSRIDLRRLPSLVVQAIREGRRLRVFPRPPYCDELIAVAAIETFDQPEGPVHELRAFVGKFDAALALEREARLLVQSGSSTIGEFIATGGEVLDEPVVALQVEQLDDVGAPVSLRVLGPSPVQTGREILALAIRDEHFQAVSFSDGFTDLGKCIDSDRHVVSFSGSAIFELDGARWSWRTGADRTFDARPVLVGDLLRNVRESVFLGAPQLWIEREGLLIAPKRTELHWRPRGRGTWRPVDGSKPWGQVDLAVINDGEIRVAIGASIVPPSFEAAADRGRRELHVVGLETRTLVARGASNLDVRFEGDVAVVSLGPLAGTATIALRFRWDAELELTLTDPGYALRLLDADGKLMPPRKTLSVDGLKGLRILATREELLCMTLQANDAPLLTVTRLISGDVPLSAFTDTITQLLGSSENLDAKVDLTAIGAGDQIANIRWYAEDVDPFEESRSNAFAVLALTYGLEARAFALADPEAGSVAVSAPANQAAMRTELSGVLPPGPWLIFGRRRQGAKIRPRIVPAATTIGMDNETSLVRAIRTDASVERSAAFLQAYADPGQVVLADRRRIVDLIALARREGLPISSIDALKALDRSPALATLLLASCDSLEERAALLDLQRDLPFLWSSTKVGDWLSSFGDRIEHVRARLTDIGIDDAVAYRSILKALGDIVGLRPELAGHAKAAFLTLVASRMSDANSPIEGTVAQFVQAVWTDGARHETDRLISRHVDVDSPPQGLLSPQHLLKQQRHWEPYDRSFAEVIAAPFAIADHASARCTLNEQELRRCRDAWLYDPEFFESTVPIGIDEVLRGTRNSEVRK